MRGTFHTSKFTNLAGHFDRAMIMPVTKVGKSLLRLAWLLPMDHRMSEREDSMPQLKIAAAGPLDVR